MTDGEHRRRSWIDGTTGLVGGIALGAIAVLFVQSDARAQIGATSQIEIASSAIGNYSHAWAVDPVTRQIVHCRADNGSIRECKALPLPTAGRM